MADLTIEVYREESKKWECISKAMQYYLQDDEIEVDTAVMKNYK